jgi:two-component system, NtrC family, sensor histidine kinase HydH
VELRGRIVSGQDIVWVLLFGSLAIFGPDLQPESTTALVALGIVQVFETKIPLLRSTGGVIAAFVLKLALLYILMGWTDGISSPYFWLLILPVMSAASSLGPFGAIIASVIACGVYLSFWFFIRRVEILDKDQLVLRGVGLALIGFLAQQLVDATRVEARKAQAAADQLAEANRNLREAEDAVRRSDRLAALGQLTAGLAHELRNPLGTIKTSAEMLLKNVDSSNAVAREMAGYISSEVDRTNSLVTRFLDFARPLALRLEKTDLTQVIDRAVADVEKHQPPFDIAIYKNYSPDIPPFLVDGQLMERVLYNLILNAAQASPSNASVTVKTRQLNGTVEIDVIDRGAGIDPKEIKDIFNPFYTTKSSGVGLGLAIVSKIVDEHGGQIAVESEPGGGSVFRVYLPFQESMAQESIPKVRQ